MTCHKCGENVSEKHIEMVYFHDDVCIILGRWIHRGFKPTERKKASKPGGGTIGPPR